MLTTECILITVAEAVKGGIEAAGGKATIYQYVYLVNLSESMFAQFTCRVPETLPTEVLAKMHAPAKSDYAIATLDTLLEHDAFLLGIPTRYGNMPAQWKVSLRFLW